MSFVVVRLVLPETEKELLQKTAQKLKTRSNQCHLSTFLESKNFLFRPFSTFFGGEMLSALGSFAPGLVPGPISITFSMKILSFCISRVVAGGVPARPGIDFNYNFN